MNLDEKTVDYGIRVLEAVGVPTAVAFWLMFRTDRKLEENTKAVVDLTIAVNKMEIRR